MRDTKLLDSIFIRAALVIRHPHIYHAVSVHLQKSVFLGRIVNYEHHEVIGQLTVVSFALVVSASVDAHQKICIDAVIGSIKCIGELDLQLISASPAARVSELFIQQSVLLNKIHDKTESGDQYHCGSSSNNDFSLACSSLPHIPLLST